ncbi:MAG: Hsp33 family molecular chaperone HslO [Proteobacteria bacterium]|nr:Hsp33 family molecular chaperone HslO [Pseudomonadota bacterium]
MSELHRFVFEGLPVRGALVRLTDAWQEILQRRQLSATGAWPQPVRALLGEMTAAGALMQANIKFDGALILQIFGDGPVKLAVAEVQADLRLRATATVEGEVAAGARLSGLVNVGNKGRCAITLDPRTRAPGRQPYQGVVPLFGDRREKIEALSAVLEHYMLQSEQLDTKLVLAADDRVAAGLLIQRMPAEGGSARPDEERIGLDEDYNRIATLAASLTREELLTLDADTVLRRLFWQERLQRFAPRTGADGPRFACTCSSERVAAMIRGLGQDEAAGIIAERGEIEVGCEFCGRQYRFDAVDAAQLFAAPGVPLPRPGSSAVH